MGWIISLSVMVLKSLLLGKYWPRGLLAELFEPSFELLLELEPPQAVIALTKTAVVNKYSGNFIDISLE